MRRFDWLQEAGRSSITFVAGGITVLVGLQRVFGLGLRVSLLVLLTLVTGGVLFAVFALGTDTGSRFDGVRGDIDDLRSDVTALRADVNDGFDRVVAALDDDLRTDGMGTGRRVPEPSTTPGGLAAGLVVGAALGTVFGAVGTAVGAVVGGLIGNELAYRDSRRRFRRRVESEARRVLDRRSRPESGRESELEAIQTTETVWELTFDDGTETRTVRYDATTGEWTVLSAES
ncbi:MAG: hypothetical protein ABEI99_11935 [Halobaculum sp.]